MPIRAALVACCSRTRALRTCLGLSRRASTVATTAPAKYYPLSTSFAVDTLRMHIRHLARIPEHYLPSVPVIGYCNPAVIHRKTLLPAARPLSPLWCLRQPKVRLNIQRITNKSNSPTPALKKVTLPSLHADYLDRTHIYTDGSVSSTSSAYAVIVPTRQAEIIQRISHKTTSTGTELVKLRAAVHYIGQQTPHKWAVFCDSRAALQCLQSVLRHADEEQLVEEIRVPQHRKPLSQYPAEIQKVILKCGLKRCRDPYYGRGCKSGCRCSPKPNYTSRGMCTVAGQNTPSSLYDQYQYLIP